MNLSYFISRKISKASPGSFSRIINRIAVIGIALGLSIMIISFLILEGFQNTIKQKIFSFSAHLHISKYSFSNTYEEQPLMKNTLFFKNATSIEGVSHIQAVAHKAGIIKTGEHVEGVIYRGVGPDFNIEQFRDNMFEGEFLNLTDTSTSNNVLISRQMANKLELELKDDFLIYFVQYPPRYRKLTVKGIYETSMEDFDKQFVIGDIRLIQRLNNWGDTLVGSYEVFADDFNNLDQVSERVFDAMDFDLYLEKVTEKYIQIFDWLTLLNKNVNIFLILILFVAAFNMVAILFILIMERTQMIGLLKALGATNRQIREIFVYNGLLLVAKGLFFGNLIGLGFGFIQSKFELIKLDPENYYMKTVPIYWDWSIILTLNVLTLLTIALVLILPTYIISKISPVKAIKFD